MATARQVERLASAFIRALDERLPGINGYVTGITSDPEQRRRAYAGCGFPGFEVIGDWMPRELSLDLERRVFEIIKGSDRRTARYRRNSKVAQGRYYPSLGGKRFETYVIYIAWF